MALSHKYTWNSRFRASYDAKITKNLTPSYVLLDFFYNQIFKKFERTFFDQVAIDAK